MDHDPKRDAFEPQPERYHLERRIAVGGMGELIVGYVEGKLGFRKQVVIKRMLRDDPESLKLFKDEARVASRLSHPNIVQCYDVAEIDGAYGLVMEYIDGVNLEQVLEICDEAKEPLPMELAAFIAAEVAAGLHYAHNVADEMDNPLHIVHRDVAPPNIMLSTHGAVKIIDFGIAKHEDSLSVTQVGRRRGRIAYMSPEYVLGQRLGPRSDIYILGTVLCEMLTLRRAIQPTKHQDAMRAILAGDLDIPRLSRPELPEELHTIIDRMIATQPEDRFSDANAVSVAIRMFLSSHSDPAEEDLKRLIADRVKAVRSTRLYEEAKGTGETLETPAPASMDRTIPDAMYPKKGGVQSGKGPPSDQDKPASSLVVGDPDVDPSGTPEEIEITKAALSKMTQEADSQEPTTSDFHEDTVVEPRRPIENIASSAAPSERPPRPKTKRPRLRMALVLPALGGILATVVVATVLIISGRGQEILGKVVPATPSSSGAERAKPAAQAPTSQVKDTSESVEEATSQAAGDEPSPELGTLTLTSDPILEVLIGEESLGMTPIDSKELPPGRVQLVLRSRKHGLHRPVPITIDAGKHLEKNIVLHHGQVTVEAPEGLNIFVGRRLVGQTPLDENLHLYEGMYRIRAVDSARGIKLVAKVRVIRDEVAVVTLRGPEPAPSASAGPDVPATPPPGPAP